MKKIRKSKFDIGKYKFKEQIEKLFSIKDLSQIHWHYKVRNERVRLLDNPLEDQKTAYHKFFYDNVANKTEFYDVYDSFLREELLPLVNNKPIIYQKIPTFRVHLPNNLGVGEFHRDRDYSHSPKEINIFLPLTEAKDTNTIWVESEEGKEDFSPLNAEYGDFYIWDGANLKHGNKANTSSKTRVSVDFRIMSMSDYEYNNRVTTGNSCKLIIGEYFDVLNK